MKFTTLRLITAVLIVFVISAVPFANNTAAFENVIYPDGNSSDGDDFSPPVIPVPVGLSGTITAGILVDKLAPDAEEMVFLGTSAGLYIIADGEIQDFIYTAAPVADIVLIDDCTGDGIRELVFCLKTSFYPGVQCYDVSEGVELWHFNTASEVRIEYVCWTDFQSISVDLQPVIDLNGDGVAEVAVASGPFLYMVDGKTGKALWVFESEGKSRGDEEQEQGLEKVITAGDVDGDGIIDLVSFRDGFLYIVSGRNGGLLRRILLVEEEEDNYYYYTYDFEKGIGSGIESISDVACFQVEGRSKAVVSFTGSGDSALCLIDLRSGSIEWENSTIYGSSVTEAELSPVDDITGDSIPDVLVCWNMSSDIKLSLLDGDTGEAVWNASLPSEINIPVIDVTVIDDRLSVLVHLGGFGPVEKVAVVDMQTGEMAKILEVTLSAEVSSSYTVEYRAAGFDNNSLIIASDDGDLMLISSQGERLWYLPRVGELSAIKSQFNSDSASDILLYCDRVMSVVDGFSAQALWHYKVPYDDLLASGGLGFIRVISDINSDQCQDILASLGTEILVFDGNKGDILLDFPVDSQITALDMIETDGGGVAFIVSTAADIFIITPEGEQVCSLPYSNLNAGAEFSENSFLVLDDVNQDGTSDLSVLSGNSVLILESSPAGDSLNFVAGTTDILPDDVEAVISQELVADIDEDGYREIHLEITRTEKEEIIHYSLIVSPFNGKAMLELEEAAGLLLDPGCADFNGDGYLDTIAYWTSDLMDMDYQERKIEIEDEGAIDYNYWQPRGPRLAVISGKDETNLWSYQYDIDYINYYEYDESSDSENYIPAAPYNDLENSETPYLAFTEMDPFGDKGGTEFVKIVNVPDKAIIREVNVASGMGYRISEGLVPVNSLWVESYEGSESIPMDIYMEDSSPGSRPELLKDLDGDGYGEIALFERQTSGNRNMFDFTYPSEVHPVIANLATGEIMSYFLLPCSELIELDSPGKAGMIGDNGIFYFLDTLSDLQITTPSDGASLSSPVKIKLHGSSQSCLNIVFVDDVLSYVTHQPGATLKMKPGSHMVTVYSLDRYGRVSIQSVDIKVKNQPLYLIPVAALIVLVLAAVASPRIIRAVDKRHLRKVSGKTGD